MLGHFACFFFFFVCFFFVVCGFFLINFFQKNLSRIPLECQTVWTQIRPDVLSGLIWFQTVCTSYQQTTKVAISGERVKVLLRGVWGRGLVLHFFILSHEQTHFSKDSCFYLLFCSVFLKDPPLITFHILFNLIPVLIVLGLCWGLTTRQPLRVILCRLPEKGRKEIEERE